MSSAVKFPPLMGPKSPSVPNTPPGAPPLSAPALFGGMDDNNRLREENENLRRELLDRLRGGNKFISGGQFRSGSRGAMQCRACQVSSRAFADAARRLQIEQKQRQRLQEQYDDECANAEALQRSVNFLEAKLAAQQSEDADKPSKVEEPQPMVAFGEESNREAEELKRSLQRLQAENALHLERSHNLQKELDQQRILAMQLGEEVTTATSNLQSTQQKLEDIVQQEIVVRTEKFETEAQMESVRKEKELIAQQLRDATAEAQRLAQESHIHKESVIVTQVQLANFKEQTEQDMKSIYESLKKTELERDKYEDMSKDLEIEKNKVEGEVSDLRRKFQAAAHAAAMLAKLEKEKELANLRADNEEREKLQVAQQKDDIAVRLNAEQQQTNQLQAEVNQLLMERAAINAQLQSMVQLVVVAPSVNVSLGPGQGRVCSPGVAAVEGQVADVIEREILPSFMKVFTSNLPSNGAQGSSAVPNGFVEQLVADMQRTIGEHLKPVLSQAWKREKG